jgi:von Willebrand factor type A domain/Putative Flp pilus-assembly TadE/G-like
VLTSFLAGPAKVARCFLANINGNISIIWAVSLFPAALLFAGALQYSIALSAQTKLNALADASALSAVSSAAAAAYQTNGTTQQAYATNMFNTGAAQINGVTVTSLSVNVVPTAATQSSPAYLTATVAYAATVKSAMPGILGSWFNTVNGTATASSSLPAYVDFYLLLDDSPSMGIGASPSDITAMQNANNGCAFACHSPHATDGTYPGYTLPAVPGTQLRIDALRNASSQLISTAISSEVVPNQFRIGLYTFANTVTTLSDLTTNLSSVQSLNSSIALPVTDIGTQIGDAVDWLTRNKVTANSGTGASSSPIKFVFLVTDGVEDQAFNYTPGNYDALLSPVGSWYGTPYSAVMHSDACTALKNKGVTIAVLYTNYDPLSDTRYTQMVQPFVNNIPTALQACASPNFFFQADHASDISTAMQQMFAQALKQAARLTN